MSAEVDSNSDRYERENLNRRTKKVIQLVSFFFLNTYCYLFLVTGTHKYNFKSQRATKCE